MPTPIGRRNTRVQILAPVMVNGVQTWNTRASVVNTVWASIETSSGSESAQGAAGTPPGMLVSTVTLPYLSATMRPRMRLAVVGGSRVLEIDSAIDVESKHIEWELACKEVAS